MFSTFDTDGNDMIDATNLMAAFKAYGWGQTTEEEINEIMAEHDVDGDLKLSFDEFKDIIMNPHS